MARSAFFSFHYERDVQRASVVRKSDVVKESTAATFIDSSLWEKAKTSGDEAVKRLINDAILGTSVTVVLIGTETANRKWVQYEIDKSIERGNGLIGVYIHNIKDWTGARDSKGVNPLPYGYKTYDWVNDNGYENLGDWVNNA